MQSRSAMMHEPGALPRRRSAGPGLAWLAAVALLVVAHLWAWKLLLTYHKRRDFTWIYMAGRAWWSHLSPYDLNALVRLRAAQQWGRPPPYFWSTGEALPPFVYPPHWIVVALPAALLTFSVATGIWDLVNYVSLVGACLVCWRMSSQRVPAMSKPLLLAAVALCTLSSGTRWSLGDNQMDLLPLLGVAAALWACQTHRTAWLAIGCFVALLKPQIGLAPVLYLFLRDGRRGVSLGGVAVLVVSLLAMVPSGLERFPTQVLNSMHAHEAFDFNAPSRFYDVAALLSPLSAGSAPFAVSAFLGLGFVALLALWKPLAEAEAMRDPLWRFGVLMATSVAFFPQHGYGFAVYVPIIVLALQFRPRWLGAGVALLCLVLSHTTAYEPLKNWPLIGPAACLLVLGGTVVAMLNASGPETAGAASIPGA